MNQCKYCRAIHYHHLDCPTGKYRFTERDIHQGHDHSGAVVGAIAGGCWRCWWLDWWPSVGEAFR